MEPITGTLDCYKSWTFSRALRRGFGIVTVGDAVREFNIFASQGNNIDILVNDVDVVAIGYLHVVGRKVSFISCFRKLLGYLVCGMSNWVVGAGISAAQMINVAKSAEAPQIALSAAQKSFTDELHSTLVLRFSLNEAQQSTVKRELEFLPLFEPSRSASQDHVVLAALREAIRWIYDNLVHPSQTKKKTLVVGSAMREVRAYNANPNVHYYFANKDSKDIARIALQLLEDVLKTKYKNFRKEERRVINSVKSRGLIMKKQGPNGFLERTTRDDINEVIELAKSFGPVTKAVESVIRLHDMIRLVEDDKIVPHCFKFDLNKSEKPEDTYTQLLFEDVGYNFVAEDWLDIFDKTGALEGHGYMALPIDLVFDNYPANDIYRYWEFNILDSGVTKHISDKESALDRTISHDKHGVRHIFGSVDLTGCDNVKTSESYACLTNWGDNGYVHSKRAWRTLLDKPVISSKRFPFSLEINLHTRYGPMVGFSLHRVVNTKLIVRTLCLRPKDEYVLLLDLPHVLKMVKEHGAAGLKKPFRYLSVYRQEFDSVVSWGLSIAEKSLTMGAVSSFVKAHINGVSLINKELVTKWRLRQSDQCRFVYCVYFYIRHIRLNLESEAERLAGLVIGWKQRFVSLVKSVTDCVSKPFEFLWSWLYHEAVIDQLVIEPSCIKYQWDVTKMGKKEIDYTNHLIFTKQFVDKDTILPNGWSTDNWLNSKEEIKNLTALTEETPLETKPIFSGVKYVEARDGIIEKLGPHENYVEYYLSNGGKVLADSDIPLMLKDFSAATISTNDCPTCLKLNGQLGPQVVECYHKEESNVTFAMSQKEVDELRNEILKQSAEKGNKYAEILAAVHKILPKHPFEHTCRVEYIKGGPGTGKSFIIRTLADAIRDLVVAPFLKLRADYQNQETPAGPVSWTFHTVHKALEQAGRLCIFVDEFTAYEWRLLACLLYRCGTEIVYLVGDTQQTGILEANGEGVSIVGKVDMESLSKHVPLMNFRNPKNDVMMLNEMYDTMMIPLSDVEAGIEFDDLTNWPKYARDNTFRIMHFSDQTGRILMDTYDPEGKTTVRANQGSNHDKVVLPLTTNDDNLVRIPELDLVALSRHKEKLVILHDEHPSPAINEFLDKVKSHCVRKPQDWFIRRLLDGDDKNFGKVMAGFKSLLLKYQACVDNEPIVHDKREVILRENVIKALDLPISGSIISNDTGIQQDRDFTQRPNNCLVVAVKDALGWSNEVMHEKLRDNGWYQAWVRTGKVSDVNDCVGLANALEISLCVNQKIEGKETYFNVGKGNKVMIRYVDYAPIGHFYYGCAKDPKTTEGSSVNPRNMLDMPYSSTESLVRRHIAPKGVNNPLIKVSGGKEEVRELEQRFIDYATEFVPRLVATLPTTEEIGNLIHPKNPLPIPDYDAFLMTKAFDLDCGALEYVVNYFNEEAANKIGDNFATGQLDLSIVSPLNMRGHPMNPKVKFKSYMVGPSLMYFSKNPWQTLQVQQARYLFRKVRKLPDHTGENLARYTADLFVDECLQPNVRETMQHNKICAIVERALLDMVSKNYDKQMDIEFTVNSRIYRFQLKDVDKPFKEPFIDPKKSGQGIMAWSKEAHVKFMIAFRVINAMMLDSVKPNVVYDNTFSEDEVMGEINAAMAQVPITAVNGIIDATACDSGQSRFTQLIERRIYERLGLSEFMLDWYFSFREHYIMQSKFVRASMVNVKTSGEPGTLLGNTILMGALLNGMLRGDGPFAMVIKGDDGFKRQMNLHVNPTFVDAIRAQTLLEFKLNINVPVTFCGFALADRLYPNIVRKLIKISTHRFRDYDHFVEYQESLRDWIDKCPIWDGARKNFLEVNAVLANRSEADMTRCFNQIISFSRIGREQFEECFPEREIDVMEVPSERIYSEDLVDNLQVNMDDESSTIGKILKRFKL